MREGFAILADKTTSGIKILSDNRQAGHNYFLLDRFEAGMVLTGTEVKAARDGKIQLRESYAQIDKLLGQTREKGLSLIPTKIYLKDGRIKCEIALAKGKKLHDKRESERARTAEDEARAAVRASKERRDREG